MIDNKIGAEGAITLSEMLKKNTTFATLFLACEKEERKGTEKEERGE